MTDTDWVSYYAYTTKQGKQVILQDVTVDLELKALGGYLSTDDLPRQYVVKKMDSKDVKELVVCRSCVEKGSKSEWCKGEWPESEIVCDIDEVLYLNYGNPP